jgi:HEPN domain-containing protein
MKTAVEWLHNQLLEGRHHTDKEYQIIIAKAKEIEKQQIQDAYLDGYCETAEDSQDYYTKTYETNH